MRTHPFHIITLFGLCLLSLTACNSKGYQNLNARYNGYFYADLYVDEVYQAIEDNYDYNFNDILKIYPEIDSSTIQGNSEKLDDAFKKSSQVIEWYPNSDWVDDNYLVIGKIRYLRAQFQYAIETFQYVYNKSDDPVAKQEALILLMRTYMDNGDIDRAIEVTDYIQNEPLTPENGLHYRLQLAFLHQREGEIELMRDALDDIAPYIPERDLKARVNFILGQLAEREADYPTALAYYNEAIKGTPPYELLFHTELRRLAVTDIRNQEQVERAYKLYEKLLKDGKNDEYEDKIYYSMGRLEQRRGEFQTAITHYLMALEAEEPNARTQGLASLRIGQIYYEQFENYEYASIYYDSTVMKLPEDEPGFESIKKRQEVLKELVTELNTITKNDSLLALSELSEVSLDAFLDRYLDEKEEKEQAKKKAERTANQFTGANIANTSTNAANSSGDGSWYFYNVVAAGQGQLEFQQRWGNRPLEDNWRRSQKVVIGVSSDELDVISDNPVEDSDLPSESSKPDDRAAEKAELMAGIPKTPEAKLQANQEIAEAYFECGRIYRFGLEREDLSEQSYLKLLERYPNTDLRLESLYALYTLNEQKDFAKADGYKNTIIEDYPDSLISKLLINPNYLIEQEQRNQELQLIYADAYSKYESGSYVEADQIIRQALSSYEDVAFLANMELLLAILKGYTESLPSYEQALVDFTEKYEVGELHDYAKSLISALKPNREDTPKDLEFLFSEDFKQLHLVAITFDLNQGDSEQLKTKIEELNASKFAKQRLSVGFLNFDNNTNSGIIFVNSFKTKSAAETYNLVLDSALKELNRQSDPIFHNFAISRDNFTTLFETKKLEEYIAFNKRFYQ